MNLFTIANGEKVCKFGGSSVANAGQIKKVEAILDDKRNFVVVSAPGKDANQKYKVTDMLFNLYFLTHPDVSDEGISYEKIPNESASKIFVRLCDIYLGISSELGLEDRIAGECMGELEHLARNPKATYHDMASRGENFNARIIAQYLDADFVDAADLIFISEDNPDGDNDKTMEKISALKDSNRRIIIPGFYGIDQKGYIATFPRGGSDLTGALVAAGVMADVYENWTDKDGMLCCDPRLFEGRKLSLIKHLTFREARELTYRGFEVLNDKAVGPVRKRNIPVNIRNTNNPEQEGTWITSEYRPNGPITGIAGKQNLYVLTVEKYLMGDKHGEMAKVFRVLERRGISYNHDPSGVDNVSIIMDSEAVKGIEKGLIKEIKDAYHPDNIHATNDFALIAVVGEGMKGMQGIAAKIIGCLAENGINIITLNQSALENNIVIGVKNDDYGFAIRSLYKRLFEEK